MRLDKSSSPGGGSGNINMSFNYGTSVYLNNFNIDGHHFSGIPVQKLHHPGRNSTQMVYQSQLQKKATRPKRD